MYYNASGYHHQIYLISCRMQQKKWHSLPQSLENEKEILTIYRSQITCKSKFIIQTFYPQCFCNCASSSVCSGGNEDFKVPLKQTAEKKKVKGSGSTSNQFNPLDQTCIHPESYSIALR